MMVTPVLERDDKSRKLLKDYMKEHGTDFTNASPEIIKEYIDDGNPVQECINIKNNVEINELN
jgi:hypothetical protein